MALFEMEGQNGVDTAWDIRKFDKNVLLIYVTTRYGDFYTWLAFFI